MFILFLLFAVLPIAEIMLLINVSDSIGGWNTFFIVIFSAFIGAYFVKREGLNTLAQVQQKSAKGELPGKEISEGLLLLVAGVLLVTPGFITDIVGLLFTLPFTRAPIASALVKQVMARQARGQNVHFSFYQQHSQTSHQQHSQSPFKESGKGKGEVIDGDYRDKTDIPDEQDALPEVIVTQAPRAEDDASDPSSKKAKE
ncbi:FxsA family protein [Ningiella sp. W23]|uniref:FxsA family protein n=1 Tax=Ningiella sp. W23 TaxID=3023715 RepID=UPI003757BA1D